MRYRLTSDTSFKDLYSSLNDLAVGRGFVLNKFYLFVNENSVSPLAQRQVKLVSRSLKTLSCRFDRMIVQGVSLDSNSVKLMKLLKFRELFLNDVHFTKEALVELLSYSFAKAYVGKITTDSGCVDLQQALLTGKIVFHAPQKIRFLKPAFKFPLKTLHFSEIQNQLGQCFLLKLFRVLKVMKTLRNFTLDTVSGIGTTLAQFVDDPTEERDDRLLVSDILFKSKARILFCPEHRSTKSTNTTSLLLGLVDDIQFDIYVNIAGNIKSYLKLAGFLLTSEGGVYLQYSYTESYRCHNEIGYLLKRGMTVQHSFTN